MGRRLLRTLGFLVYCGVVAVVFTLSGYAAFSVFVRSGVTAVPELAGLPEEDARALLADQGLRLKERPADDSYDDGVALGDVLRQKPPAGSLVKRGRSVEVVVSRGPHRIAVPDLVGQAVQAAQVTLSAAGLQVGRTASVYSATQAPGLVTQQSPPAGSLVDRTAPIGLFVALEDVAETYVMPDLIYRSYDDVRRFFDRRGFKLGSVKFEPYEGIARGVVLRQFPLPGHPLRRHATIALVVAAAQGEGS